MKLEDTQPSSVATVTLPRLQYASISSELSRFQSIPLLSALIIPIMTTLHVTTVKYRIGWGDLDWANESQPPDGYGFFEPLCRVLECSATLLTTLSLHILHMNISEHISLSEVLKFAPNLTFFSVAVKAGGSPWESRSAQPPQLAVLFELLSSMASRVPVFVPGLATFELMISYLSFPVALEIADHTIQMAERRSMVTSQATLTTVRLTFRNPERDWIIDRTWGNGVNGAWDVRRVRGSIFSEQSLLHRLEALEQRGTKFIIAEPEHSDNSDNSDQPQTPSARYDDHSPTDSWY